MLPVSSLQNPVIKRIRSLAVRKGRREAGQFVAEGHAMLERALALGWQPDIFVATKPQTIWEDVKPLLVTEKVMAELSGQNNPLDVLAVFSQRFQPHPAKEGLWLALEEIRDPGNLGTILRTADATSVSGIILAGSCCDPFSPEAVRASTGSIFALPIVNMKVEGLIDFARAWPSDCVGTLSTAKQDFRRTYASPTLLLMGNETRGLSQALSAACNMQVRIPMKPGVESLNLATATALMLYEIVKP